MAHDLSKAFLQSCAATALLCAVSACPASAQALKGDWPMMNFDARGQRYNPYETALGTKSVKNLQLAWKIDIGDTHSAPVVAGGVLYAGSDDGHLYARDAATGKPVWSVKSGKQIITSPAVADGAVYVGTTDGKLQAYDATTGAALWSATLDASACGSPTVWRGKIYIGAASGTLFAFDGRSGALLWNTDRWAAGNTNAPAVSDGVVYSLNTMNEMVAFDAASGTKLWDQTVDFSNAGSWGSPIVYDGKIYANDNRSITALDAGTGSKLWQMGLGPNINGSIALAKGHIYGATEDFVVWDYRASTGALLKVTDEGNALLAAPTIANNVLYAVSWGSVGAFNTSSGKALWSAPIDQQPWVSPVVSNGRLYVADGSLYAFALPD